jgi:predicted ArsR family transcriptional regulator
MMHLKHLEAAGLIEKEEILRSKPGRPKMLYMPSAKLLEMLRTKSD